MQLGRHTANKTSVCLIQKEKSIMKKTNLITRIIALSLTIICIITLASLAHIAASAAVNNETDNSKVITLQEESDTENQLPDNLCISCDSLEEAIAVTGINIKLPEYIDSKIYAVKGQYIEVQYAIDENSTMTIRKSADETEYTDVDCDYIVQFETENGITVYGKWENDHNEYNKHGFAGAYFAIDDGTYSLSFDCILQVKDLSVIIDEICLS